MPARTFEVSPVTIRSWLRRESEDFDDGLELSVGGRRKDRSSLSLVSHSGTPVSGHDLRHGRDRQGN